MNLKICFLGLAVAVAAIQPRQQNEDAMDLYLCSNPDFNHDCAGCACERLANLTTVGGYGGPPCCMLSSSSSLSPFHLTPFAPRAASLLPSFFLIQRLYHYSYLFTKRDPKDWRRGITPWLTAPRR